MTQETFETLYDLRQEIAKMMEDSLEHSEKDEDAIDRVFKAGEFNAAWKIGHRIDMMLVEVVKEDVAKIQKAVNGLVASMP